MFRDKKEAHGDIDNCRTYIMDNGDVFEWSESNACYEKVGVNNELSIHGMIEKLKKENKQLHSTIEQFKVCNTCCGEPISGKPCICGGTGRSSDEVAGLRGELIKNQELVYDLSGELEELKKSNNRKIGLTYTKAKRAIELFELEYIGQDTTKLWKYCVEKAMKGE